MNTTIRLFRRRAGVVAAVAATVLLGNLRTATSSAASIEAPPRAVTASPAVRQVGGVDRDHAAAMPENTGTAATRAKQDESSDDPRLVPAIYAWDADVRFVYYRQISKWM